MRSIFLGSLVALTAAIACPQELSILPYPLPISRFEQVKKFLNLTDPQVLALQQVVQAKSDAEQVIYRQISDKHQALYTLMQSNTADAFQVGRLTLEIRDLQKQVPIAGGPYRTNALNTLTAEQRAKLPQLASAMQLAQTAYEAVWMNLIDAPESRPMPLDIQPAGGGAAIGRTMSVVTR